MLYSKNRKGRKAVEKFTKGQKVNIINATLGGRFIVEGVAKIVRPVRGMDSQYVVDFGDGYGPVERFVDPQAQADAAAFVERLNTRAA